MPPPVEQSTYDKTEKQKHKLQKKKKKCWYKKKRNVRNNFTSGKELKKKQNF